MSIVADAGEKLADYLAQIEAESLLASSLRAQREREAAARVPFWQRLVGALLGGLVGGFE